MPRLDAGSYVPPLDGGKRDTKLRWYFWQAIRKGAPEVLAQLRSDVYPHYRKAAMHNRRRGKLPLNIAISRPGVVLRLGKCPKPLQDALNQWMVAHQFSDGWIAEDALAMMANLAGAGGERGKAGLSMLFQPDLRASQALGPATIHRLAAIKGKTNTARSLQWRASGYQNENPELFLADALSVDFQFVTEGWNPLDEEREDYRSMVEKQFSSHLTSYLDAIKDAYKSAGMQETSSRSSLEVHLSWLVRYLFTRTSYAEIAEGLDLSEQTVGDAVRLVIKDLNLSFKPSRGRKRGSKNISH